ncbi:hypothetical protein [Bacillus velezensis]
MGKIRKTYDIHFKKKFVDLHLNDGIGYQTIAREMNKHNSKSKAIKLICG